MNFGNILKCVRSDSSMTQKSLGDTIGVTSVTIGNWERGVRQPSFDQLPKLADALDTSIDALFGRDKLKTGNIAEEELLTKYRKLDKHGQKLIHSICDIELERMYPSVISAAKLQNENFNKKHNRYIPLYLYPPAAGIAATLEGNEFEMILADDSVPVEADYAVHISGDSMEPYIKNGDMVFVKETQELRNGDVGVFCVDGVMYCKQYYMDDNQNMHLLSSNPQRANANIHASCESNQSIKCCGKVILDIQVPLQNSAHK